MSYKVLAHDDKAYHVMHKDGTRFSIAKKGLSKATKEKIEALYWGGEVQHFDDGGQVLPSKDALMALSDNLKAPPESPVDDEKPGILGQAWQDTKDFLMSPAGTFKPSTPGPVDAKDTPQPASYHPSAAPEEPDNSPAASPDKPMDAMSAVPGLKDMAAAIGATANAKSSGEGQINDALNQAKQQQAMANLKYGDQEDEAKTAQDVAEENYNNFQMKPNRVWTNMNNGQKAAAAIGLILGGIGSGLTHQPNAALGVLDKAINDDIDAQKAELGKRHNLLTEAYQKTKDIRAAEAETRLTINSSLQTQIQAAMAQTQSQVAKQQGAIALAQLKMQAPQLAAQMMEFQMRQKAISGAEIPPQYAELLPKDVRERSVTVQGEHGPKIALAKSPDAAKEFDKVNVATTEMKSKIRDATRFMLTQGTTLNPLSAASGQADTLYNDMVTTLGKVGDLARFTPEEAKHYKDMIPHPGQVLTQRGIAQLQQLDKILTDKANAAAGTYLENYNPGKFQMGAPVRK